MRNPLEKLAREICWLGFANRDPKIVGCTKVQYWKRLAESKKQDYRSEARQFMYIYDNVSIALLVQLCFRDRD